MIVEGSAGRVIADDAGLVFERGAMSARGRGVERSHRVSWDQVVGAAIEGRRMKQLRIQVAGPPVKSASRDPHALALVSQAEEAAAAELVDMVIKRCAGASAEPVAPPPVLHETVPGPTPVRPFEGAPSWAVRVELWAANLELAMIIVPVVLFVVVLLVLGVVLLVL